MKKNPNTYPYTTYYPTKNYEQTDAGGILLRFYLGSQEIATVEEKSWTGLPPDRRYIHPDHLGSTRVVTDASGNEVQTLYYHPFGEIRLNHQSGVYDEKRKFTGHFHDDETGLEYMQARYYTASWARFMAEDPLFVELGSSGSGGGGGSGNVLSKLLTDPQSLNSYAYARNNPLQYTDPTGQSFRDDANGWIESQRQTTLLMGDFITFGAFSQTFGAAQQVARETRSAYDNKKLNAGMILTGSAKVIASALTLAGVGLFTGMSAGELYAQGLGFISSAMPLGFSNANQYKDAVNELNTALAESGITDAKIGVRGSSVTGTRFRTGEPFGPKSDIDFYVESDQLTKGFNNTSRNIPGFVHPEKINNKFNAIKAWSEKWTENLGRKVTAGGFKSGTVPKNN